MPSLYLPYLPHSSIDFSRRPGGRGGNKSGLRVSEIKADGHCLYRAMAEQLSVTKRRPELTEESYPLMRQEAARWAMGCGHAVML